MSRPFVVSASPLSGSFREELDRSLGDTAETLNLAQLRRLAVRDLVRTVRAHRGRRAVLVLEDEASAGALPILHAVAALAGASSIEVVRADFTTDRRTTSDLARGIATVAAASANGMLAVRAARRELAQLAGSPRAELAPLNLERLLYLNTSMWFGLKAGGSVGHIAGVVNGFVERGFAVDLASATEPILVGPGVTIHRLEPPKSFGLPPELNPPRFQRGVVRALSAGGRRGYGFLYQRLALANYAGVVLSRKLGLPLVLEYNGSEVWAARNWGPPPRYEALSEQSEAVSLRHAHLVVTVSEILRDELVERGVEPDRIVWHPNGVDATRYDSNAVTNIRPQLGIDPDAVVVGFIGTFGQWHGVEVLARAVGQLAATDAAWLERHRVHVLLVGDGFRMPEVREALRGPAEKFTTLAGLVPQAEGPRYLAAADVLVSPHIPNADGSRFFGSPTKLFEYMAMGRAILASDLEQIGQVLQPSIATSRLPGSPPSRSEPAIALLTTPGSVADIVAGLRFLVEQPEWRERLGANARARVLERHTWSHHVGAIIDRLQALPTM